MINKVYNIRQICRFEINILSQYQVKKLDYNFLKSEILNAGGYQTSPRATIQKIQVRIAVCIKYL